MKEINQNVCIIAGKFSGIFDFQESIGKLVNFFYKLYFLTIAHVIKPYRDPVHLQTGLRQDFYEMDCIIQSLILAFEFNMFYFKHLTF